MYITLCSGRYPIGTSLPDRGFRKSAVGRKAVKANSGGGSAAAAYFRRYAGASPKKRSLLCIAITVPLRELSETLAVHGLDCSVVSVNRAFPMNVYWINRSYPAKAWRKHMEIGNGRIPTVVNRIVDRLYFFNNQMIQEGVESGCLVWPMPQRRRQAAVNKANQLQQEIQDKLNKAVRQLIPYRSGQGDGCQFCIFELCGLGSAACSGDRCRPAPGGRIPLGCIPALSRLRSCY